MSDEVARRRIESSLDESLLVEAAAGTGKTTALVRRLVAILESGRATPGTIAAVTFTRKAAGELTLRLRDALDRRRLEVEDSTARQRLESAIHHLEEARIGTIHGFCADLLRERPVEAGVDPAFVALENGEAERIFGRVFRRWLEDVLAGAPAAVGRALDRLAVSRGSDPPSVRLEQAAWTLHEWRDHPAPWSRPPTSGPTAESIIEMVERLAKLAAKGPSGADELANTLAAALDSWAWLEQSRRERGGGPIPPGQLEARLAELRRAYPPKRYRRKGRGASFGAVPRTLVVAELDALIAALDEWGRRADAELVAELVDELREPLRRFEQEKRRRGVLDFLDLQLLARELLLADRNVRAYLQQRFTHLFVDELQDTDPLQAEILLLLASDDPDVVDWRRVRPAPGKLFLVGDPKQSIYRFRRADVSLYRELRTQLEASGVGVLTLSRSFRAGSRLQRLVNSTFEPLLPGETPAYQADWVPLERARDEDPSRPAVVVLPVPKPSTWDSGRVKKGAIEEQLPDLVAAFVAWLIESSGWRLPGGESEPDGRPIAPRDVCLLFRKAWDFYSGDQTQPFVQALERRGIPHLQTSGRSFYEREEVVSLIAALTAIEWPDDELAVFATLRGPFAAIPDAALLRYRLAHGGLRPFAIPDALEGELAAVGEALARLVTLHRERNRIPLAETIRRLLDASRAWAGFALRPAGAEVLAHLERVIDLARGFELSGGLSFRGFVERLVEQSETRGIEEAPIREDGADGVRLMTAHLAKGLEFPVVICADPMTSLARDTPDRWIDPVRGLAVFPLLGLTPWDLVEHADETLAAQQAEGVRIAYVAATRARELLVLPASGIGPGDAWKAGWVGPLVEAVFPRRGVDPPAGPAPGCPPLRGSTVPYPEPHVDLAAIVAPGRHQLASGVDVVWWDPGALDLVVPDPRGLEHDGLISSSAPPLAGAVWKEAWRSWQAVSSAAVERGSEPSRFVATVTEQVLPPPSMGVVVVESAFVPGRRVGGVRFGTLVHTALRDLPLDAHPAQIEAVVVGLARVLLAPRDEVEAAAEAVARALAHPRVAGATGAERVHREWPFVVPVEGNGEEGRGSGGLDLIEGVIDFAWRRGGRWTVVDFKTDLEWDPESELGYRRQVAWYSWALATATGEPVEGVVLRV